MTLLRPDPTFYPSPKHGDGGATREAGVSGSSQPETVRETRRGSLWWTLTPRPKLTARSSAR